MPRIPVFYSFHFENDVFRVQMIRNMGVVDGDEPVSVNDWEQIRRRGSASIAKWIDDNMAYRRCVVVLIGEETANRPWVKYEIVKAWNDQRALFGIHIHNLKDLRTGTCRKGANPFSTIQLDNGRLMSDYITCHDPNAMYAYDEINSRLSEWVDTAIVQATNRWPQKRL